MPSHSRRPKRRPKTISAQGLTGQQGINFVENVVLETGSRWTPSGPNEVGIDGYIELFDPNSRQPLGLNLAVQSKVVTAIGSSSDPTFDYWCAANDLDYWLRMNMPVVLVVSSPATREGYWISISGHFKGWKHGDSTQVTFVKSRDRFNRDAFHKLAEVAAPKSGLYLAPVRRAEYLRGNLLCLDSFPSSLFIADTEYRTPRELRNALRETKQETDGVWVLWEKKIITFHDLGEEPWSSVSDPGTRERFATSEWSTSSDPTRQRVFVQLLNQTLREQISSKVRYWPQEDSFAMAGLPRKMPYQSLKRRSKISVVSAFSTITSDDRKFEWFRHLAFRGQFRFLDGTWYLEITPTYRFTRDGHILDRFHSDRLKGIKRLEGNRAVLSSILFWADYLRPRTSLFDTTVTPLQFGELVKFECDVGIVDQQWLSKDPEYAHARELESKELLFDFQDGVG